MQRRQGFTLIELLVVISIIALLIGILLPALGAARRTAREMQSKTQIRGIHQAMVIFSQGNNTRFPGLDSDGTIEEAGPDGDLIETVDGSYPQPRYGILLRGNFFTGEYAISPIDSGLEEWTSDNVEANNYSYAMLMIGEDDQINGTENNSFRVREWKDTINTEAVVMSDRNTGGLPDDPTSNTGGEEGEVSSISTELDSGEWRGVIAWNDNHVSTETTQILATRYTGGQKNLDDNDPIDQLFAADDVESVGAQELTEDAEAAMVYHDDTELEDQTPVGNSDETE